jgi:hypothetical protein
LTESDLRKALALFAEFKMTFLEKGDRQQIWDSQNSKWGPDFKIEEPNTKGFYQPEERLKLSGKGTIKGLVHCLKNCPGEKGLLASCKSVARCVPVIGKKIFKPKIYFPFESYVESARGDFFPEGGNTISNWKRRWPIFKEWLKLVVGKKEEEEEILVAITLLDGNLGTKIQPVMPIGERTLRKLQNELVQEISREGGGDDVLDMKLTDFWKEIAVKLRVRYDDNHHVLRATDGTTHIPPVLSFALDLDPDITVGNFINNPKISLPQIQEFLNDSYVRGLKLPGQQDNIFAKAATNVNNILIHTSTIKNAGSLLELLLSKKITGVGAGVVMPTDILPDKRGGPPLLLTAIATMQLTALDETNRDKANPNGARSIFTGTAGNFQLQTDLRTAPPTAQYVENRIIGMGLDPLVQAIVGVGAWVQISLPSVPHLVNVIIRNGNIYTFGGGYNDPCVNLTNVGIPYEYGDMYLMSPDGLILEDGINSADPMNSQKIVAWGIYTSDIKARLDELLVKVNKSGKGKADGMYKVQGEKYSAVSNWFLNNILGWSNCVVTGRCIIQGQGQARWGDSLSSKFIVLPWDNVGGLDVGLLFEIVRKSNIGGGGLKVQKGGNLISLSDDRSLTIASATKMKNKLYKIQRTNPLIEKSCGLSECSEDVVGAREANLLAHRECSANLGGGSPKRRKYKHKKRRKQKTKRRRKRKTKRKRRGKKRKTRIKRKARIRKKTRRRR